MSYPVHPRIDDALDLAGGLTDLTVRLMRAAARLAPPRDRPRRGASLRPGPRTPNWNALVLCVRPHLRRWGAQSNLARMLGVPPQRVHEYFVRRTVAPDAERTLLLMMWLARGAPALTCFRARRRRANGGPGTFPPR